MALAHHLGRALQLTNILRDIDEDASIGRLYLPREALSAAGVTTDEPLAAAADPKLAQACVEVAARAREHFEKAQSIMASAPRAAVKAPRLMAAAYGSILDRMLKEGFAPPRRRVKGQPPAPARRASAIWHPVSGGVPSMSSAQESRA